MRPGKRRKSSVFFSLYPQFTQSCTACGKLPVENRKRLFFRQQRAVLQKIIHTAVHSDEDNPDHQNQRKPVGNRRNVEHQQHNDEQHLAGGFQLSGRAGGDDLSVGHGDQAQPVHREFPGHDQNHDPCGHQPGVNQHDHRGQNQQLVGHRIDELSEIGDNLVLPGNMPVQIIRPGREEKYLSDPQQYTTAYDMYLIFNEALKYEKFVEIIQTTSYETTYYNNKSEAKQISVKNTNKFLNGNKTAPDNVTVIGGKTGTTNAAGHCLVLLSKDKNGAPYVAIVLRAESSDSLYAQMTDLLEEIGK